MKIAKSITRISARSIVSASALALLLGLASQQAAAAATYTAATYSFYNITNNNAGAVADGKANLKVEVIDLGSQMVRFQFTNTSTSSLADIYFDDGTLLGISSLSDSDALNNSSQVNFTAGSASPGNLPSGNNADPDFAVTAGFLADSDAKGGITKNGVSGGEWLAIDFNLQSGKTYANVLSALTLHNSGGIGDLRIGVHVQGFASGGGSESFINNISPVPEADTWAMMGAGLGLVGFMARRRRHATV